VDKERMKKLLFRLDEFGSKLILEGEYYKRTVRDIKKELKKEGLF